MIKQKPKILVLDIETAPNIVTSWGLWIPQQYLSHENLLQEKYIIGAAWKWYGQKGVSTVYVDSNSPTNDFNVASTLQEVLCEADAVVAHNGDKFDLRWIRARILFHKLPPIPKLFQIDTKKLCKTHFHLNSNKLDYIAKYLGIGSKLQTDYSLWKKCMVGDEQALATMKKYNIWDVILLEKVFTAVRPHVPAKINMRLFGDRAVCPSCGSKHIQYRGFTYTSNNKYRRFQCTSCGKWDRETKAEPKE